MQLDVTSKKPEYLFSKMCSEHRYNTRKPVLYGTQFSGKSSLAAKSFCYRGTLAYNKLPQDMMREENIETFKRKLKKWIFENIKIEP